MENEENRESLVLKYIERKYSDVKMVKKITSIDGLKSKKKEIRVHFIYKDMDDVERKCDKIIDLDVLKVEGRNIKIEELLTDSDTIEDLIYTDEQQEKLDKLRWERDYNNKLTTEQQAVLDRENSFKLGDSITFKDSNPGIITFVGGIRGDGIRKYTVKLQDDEEHRFVMGKDLKARVKRERIEIPENSSQKTEFLGHVARFEKMVTERIIKYKNGKGWYQIYYDNSIEYNALLYVLQERGHHKRKKKISVDYNKSA